MLNVCSLFASLIKHQLGVVLKIIELEENGIAVSVDEIFLDLRPTVPKVQNQDQEKGPTAPVIYEKLLAFRSHEPRLILICHFLSRLITFAKFYSKGRRVAVDGFRLQDLNYWARYSCEEIFDNLGELCSACNCDCKLCFLKGSAVDFPKKSVLSLLETQTRIKYFKKEKKLGLPIGNTQPGEPFLNPHALDILKMARRVQPGVNIGITTNGDLLSENLIKVLADLKPIILVISINSADPINRRRIMKSRRAAEMIAAIPLLREYGVQFSGSILAPADLPLSDLENTARFLDRNEAVVIRVALPGFTRYHSLEQHFDTPKRWDGIVDMVDSLRDELATPFLVCPSFYWNRSIAAYVDGVFANSPAWRAGLKFGDRIVAIDGQKIITKVEAAHFLAAPAKKSPLFIKFERGQEIHETELIDEFTTEDDFYPFKPVGYPVGSGYMGKLYGLHFIDGFHLDDAIQVFDIIKRYPDVKQVLLFTTLLVKDLFAQAVMIMEQSPALDLNGVELNIAVAEQRFWGGNIVVGDLHVVQDYIDHLIALEQKGYCPDLVIIPRSFAGDWGMDLLGQSYMEIERKTGFRVELVNNRRIMI